MTAAPPPFLCISFQPFVTLKINYPIKLQTTPRFRWKDTSRRMRNNCERKEQVDDINPKRKQKCYIVLLYTSVTKIMSEKCCCVVDPKKPLTEYIGNLEHFGYATKCSELLDRFDNLRVYEARCHRKKPKKSYPYTCWYVSFKHIREEKICFILHFQIQPSNIHICFRFIDYAPQEVKTRGKLCIRDKSKYLHFKNYENDEGRLIDLIKEYLKRIEPYYDKLNCDRRIACG